MYDSAGVMQYAASYDPYGSPFEQFGLGGSLGFTGEHTDANGLQYLRARYYNPSLGTFLSRDPVMGMVGGESIRWNPYTYAGANPANYVDPSGRWFWFLAVPLILGTLSAAYDIRGQIYANQMRGMSLGDAIRNVDGWKSVGEGAKTFLITGVGALAFNGVLMAAPWIAGFIGITAPGGVGGTAASLFGVGTIGVAGAVSGQAARATANLIYERDFGEGLGNPLDIVIDATLSVGLFRLFGGNFQRVAYGWKYKGVEIVDSRGSPLGELDEVNVYRRTFFEDKEVRGLQTLHPKTGMPQQTAAQWAEKAIFRKTEIRIRALTSGTSTRPTVGGSPDVPTFNVVQGINRFHFRLEGNTPDIIAATRVQLANLKHAFPKYRFTASFGHK